MKRNAFLWYLTFTFMKFRYFIINSIVKVRSEVSTKCQGEKKHPT